MAVRAPLAVAVLVLSLVAGAPGATAAEPAPFPALTLTRVAAIGGLTAMATRTGDRTLYVADQEGRVWAVRNRQVVEPPLLDISGDVTAGGEQGLLGLAFSPDGSKLYVHYTAADQDARVDEFTMQGRAVDVGSRREVLAVAGPAAQPQRRAARVRARRHALHRAR